MIFDMLSYYQKLRESHIHIIYSGPIWADGVEGIGQTLRKRLALDDLPLTASQSVFSVFIEQMNNMLMYSAERQALRPQDGGDAGLSSGVFILGARDKKYFLQSGNLIQNDRVEPMRERLDHLNSLDKAGLRQFYKEQLKAKNNSPNSRGAGLGLIEIARRASSKIEYVFSPMEEGQTFFAMYVEIG